jgi:hypothetical protein
MTKPATTPPAAPPEDAIEYLSQRFYESLTDAQRAELEQAARDFIEGTGPHASGDPVGILSDPDVLERIVTIDVDFAHTADAEPVARINPHYRPKGQP